MATGDFPCRRCEVIFQKLIQLILASGTAMALGQPCVLIERYKTDA
jgi:hypothetical protein